MNWIKGIRYEGVLRFDDGRFFKRFWFTKKDKIRGYKLIEGKNYFFLPDCPSYSDRMGILGTIRSFDYNLNESIPYIFKIVERDKVLDKENSIIGSVLDSDHFYKISQEAKKGKGLELNIRTVMIGLIILAGIYYFLSGEALV